MLHDCCLSDRSLRHNLSEFLSHLILMVAAASSPQHDVYHTTLAVETHAEPHHAGHHIICTSKFGAVSVSNSVPDLFRDPTTPSHCSSMQSGVPQLRRVSRFTALPLHMDVQAHVPYNSYDHQHATL